MKDKDNFAENYFQRSVPNVLMHNAGSERQEKKKRETA